MVLYILIYDKIVNQFELNVKIKLAWSIHRCLVNVYLMTNLMLMMTMSMCETKYFVWERNHPVTVRRQYIKRFYVNDLQ